MPRVSVIIPAYNHEKYVAQAIQSVLDQTYQDFEIVITDDGSTDGTVKEIKKFKDPRIKLFTFGTNQGAAIATTKCIKEATGEYFAVLNSDDIFVHEKLQKQIKFLDENPDVWAVFGHALIIDENGNNSTDKSHLQYYNWFRQPNRTRFEWLNYFFFKGNALCHPSVLSRRECYTEICLPDPRLAQTGDFNRWMKVCLKHEIYVIAENLVKFRVRDGEKNVSGRRPEAKTRRDFEYLQILRNYLTIENVDDFLEIFPTAVKYKKSVEKDLIPFFVAMVALEMGPSYPLHQLFSINVLFELLGDKDIAKKLEKKCGFRYIDFINQTDKLALFNESIMLSEKERNIQRILNSKSWRITAPLRSLYNLINKGKIL